MPAKYWLLPLFALAVLGFAAHGPARADQEQFVVTYVEFLPREFLPAERDIGGELLEQLAALGRRQGAISFTVNQEIQRPNFFVLLEIWMNAGARAAFEDLPQTKALLAQIQPLLEVPFDERPGTLIE
jgi:quinol monooxygenase YgiN